ASRCPSRARRCARSARRACRAGATGRRACAASRRSASPAAAPSSRASAVAPPAARRPIARRARRSPAALAEPRRPARRWPRSPAVPTWAVGLLSQERSLAGAFAQPIVGSISDRTRTRIGRRRPFFIVGVSLTAASLLFLAGFPPLVPMVLVLSVNAFFLNVA